LKESDRPPKKTVVVYSSGVLYITVLFVSDRIQFGQREPATNERLAEHARVGDRPPLGYRLAVMSKSVVRKTHGRPTKHQGWASGIAVLERAAVWSWTGEHCTYYCAAGRPFFCRARKPGTRWLRTGHAVDSEGSERGLRRIRGFEDAPGRGCWPGIARWQSE
jgi:hypothetical protein